MTTTTKAAHTAGLASYYLQHSNTGMFARNDTDGEHDGRVTADLARAKWFPSFGAASEFNKNFGSFEVVTAATALSPAEARANG